MNEHRLRKLAQKVLREREAKAVEEREEELAKQAEERELEIHRQISEWPAFIEQEVEKAALAGEFSYAFECGDCDSRVEKHLFEYFSSLDPSMTTVEKTEILNYDMGTSREYFVRAIRFRW